MNGLSLADSIKVAALTVSLTACSADPASPPDSPLSLHNKTGPTTPVRAEQPAPSVPLRAEAAPARNVLTLRGLGALRIGEAVPAGSSWSERGAQIPGPCRTISSPEFPGVYAIVEEGEVRRITVGQRSRVKLTEGIGTGASEAEVRAAFPGFREEPHKYVERPAKYLTAANAADRDPALRFEIDQDGKVSVMHVGTMPVLAYVEGCA